MNANWRTARDHGKEEFARGNYRQALDDFSVAATNCPESEKHIVLSNMVACRLKLGEQEENHSAAMEQYELALSDAKACVRANPRYSKGYVRLASAHMALGHSNDACQALQTAISLDPNNRMAKQMLVQELRRDHHHQQRQRQSSSSSESSTTAAPVPPVANSTNAATNNHHHRQTYVHLEEEEEEDAYSSHTSLFTRGLLWYQSQNEDVRTMVWIALGIVLLYVGFGGRFGLESNDTMQGHYGEGNIYEQYRASSKQRRTSYVETEEEPYSYSNNYYGSGGGGSGDGIWYMLLTGLALYASHRLGISPWQMLFLVRMADRRRHFGGGGGGFLYPGGGRNFMRFGARPRRW